MKPKEYWLDLCGTLHGDPCDFVSVGKPHSSPASTNIHVIEYEAYHKAIRETVEAEDKLQEALETIENMKGIQRVSDSAIQSFMEAIEVKNDIIYKLHRTVELLRQQRNEVAYHLELDYEQYPDWFKELDKEIEDKLK